MQEKFLAKKKERKWMTFVDLEKAFDRVPREIVWCDLRVRGVDEWSDEWIVAIQGMYYGATTAVRLRDGESKEFGIKIGVHQGSVLRPLLFIIVLEALSREFRCGLPWELLYEGHCLITSRSRVGGWGPCKRDETWRGWVGGSAHAWRHADFLFLLPTYEEICVINEWNVLTLLLLIMKTINLIKILLSFAISDVIGLLFACNATLRTLCTCVY